MNNSLIIIGIAGRARTGKDLAAGFLASLRSCRRVALADGVREAFNSLSGPTGELFKELNSDHTYRHALQLLGSEARLKVNAPGLWVHLALAKIAYSHLYHPVPRSRFVIPDIRFRLEAAMIGHATAQLGGNFGLLRLERPTAAIAESGHSSESEVTLIPCDREYVNEGTVADLMGVAVHFFDWIAGQGGGR